MMVIVVVMMIDDDDGGGDDDGGDDDDDGKNLDNDGSLLKPSRPKWYGQLFGDIDKQYMTVAVWLLLGIQPPVAPKTKNNH